MRYRIFGESFVRTVIAGVMTLALAVGSAWDGTTGFGGTRKEGGGGGV